MTLPLFSGSSAQHYQNGTGPSFDISTVPNGAWMVVSAMSSTTTNTITPPTGWTTFVNNQVSGTRSNFLFAKIKASADGSTLTFTQSSTTVISYAFMWGTGSTTVDQWIMGNPWVRATDDTTEPSGARYENVARSITTTSNDTIVLAISHEATLAEVQSMEVSNVSPAGWTQQTWLAQVAVNDRIETIWAGTLPVSTAGATGDVTLTYTSPQDNNGWAVQLAIPSTAPSGGGSVNTPTVVGTPTTFSSTNISTGFTISRPSGVIAGDYVVVVVRGQHATATTDFSATGFTRWGPPFVASSAASRVDGFYGHYVSDPSTDSASYTFTFTGGSTARLVATAFIVRGVDPTTPVTGYYNSYGGTLVTGGVSVPSYAAAKFPALALFMGGSEFASPNNHVPTQAPTTFTNITSVVTSTSLTVSRTYLWVGQQTLSANPASDSIVWGTPSGAAAEGVALQGSTSTPPPPEGIGVSALDGKGNTVKVFHTTAGGPRTPASLIPVRRGFNTVTDIMAKSGATWAHRGGSASYPEMSLFAYTQSVVRGYGGLEVSLGRTSDGVWFGLHDQTTDRTSGGTYGNASSQTWAQIQAQQIVIGPGANQPYMRWDQLIAAYGNTHIFMVDPKYALSYQTEFLNMVNTSLGPTRAIIKYSGAGSGAAALSTAAQAMGFQTWGYFYATDASAANGGNGNLQTWGNSWTIVGMEYGASQAIWNEALAFGKPVYAHIVPDQTSYATAISKGASAVMVSGAAVVTPVSWWTH